VGIADIEGLSKRTTNWTALKSVKWFFFLGEKDSNDSAHERDSFSEADEKLILRFLGPVPLDRWPLAERLFQDQGLNARFQLYPSVSHVVSPEMTEDVLLFFKNCL
jgi:hypothetical protein